jgi:hypothetical protein
VILELSPAPATVRVTRGGAALGSAASLSDSTAGAANRIFRDDSSLCVKLGGSGEIMVR